MKRFYSLALVAAAGLMAAVTPAQASSVFGLFYVRGKCGYCYCARPYNAFSSPGCCGEEAVQYQRGICSWFRSGRQSRPQPGMFAPNMYGSFGGVVTEGEFGSPACGCGP